MSSKKTKHKNHSNKSPNPNSSQKLDIDSKVGPTFEDLQDKCDFKDEERVPEINEILTPPAIELKKQEDDSPKKPKRSKGKKKKQDKEDNVSDNLEGIGMDPVNDKINVDNESEKELANISSVAPNVRKKKNKKKTNEQGNVESIILGVEIPSEKIIGAVELTSPEVIEDQVKKAGQTVEQETKNLKKKVKKKKHRSDSERSDKSADNICCTTDFQKLLDDNIENPVQDELRKIEDIHMIKKESDIYETSTKVVQLGTNKDIETGTNINEDGSGTNAQDTPLLDCQENKEKVKEEKKSKKKHKKDKNHLLQEQTGDKRPEELLNKSENVTLVQSNLPITPVEVSAENVTDGKINQDTKLLLEEELKSLEIQENSEITEIFARPVENTFKIEQEIECAINSSQVVSDSQTVVEKENVTEKNVFEAIEMQGHRQEDKGIIDEVTDKIKTALVYEKTKELATDLQELEHINTTCPVIGKKKKKLPKVPPEIKATFEIPDPIQNTASNAQATGAKLADSLLGETIAPMVQDTVFSDITSKLPLSATTYSKDDVEQIDPVKDCQQRHQDKIFSLENKTGKKKKKIPKIPNQPNDDIKFEKLTGIEPEIPQICLTEEQNKPDTKKESENIIDLPVQDIEISSVKADESESSGCEITPDIHYPRALSQQLIDDNNNTVIQEIILSDETKSNISLVIPDKPIIVGSGETPIESPEFVPSGIRVTEIKTNVSVEKEEKTDLKSKMMEVNQDMEELRLSIERSLAEFTAMEKCEKDIENEFEETKLKPDEKIDIETKAMEIEEKNVELPITESKPTDIKIITKELLTESDTPPICPARKDHKGKGKSKKKGKQDTNSTTTQKPSTVTELKENTQGDKKEEKSEKTEQKTETTQDKGKQQSNTFTENDNAYLSQAEPFTDTKNELNYEPIDNFEDALSTSIDDVNKTFEMIANEVDEANELSLQQLAVNKPQINITAPLEDTSSCKDKTKPVSPPKNLLGHPDIPVSSNKTDYKKEKNKTPNTKQARVKIKDSMDVEAPKQSKDSQTENKKMKKDLNKAIKESFAHVTNENEEYVYKYSFRKVFLQNSCHVCKKDLNQTRVPCNFCNLLFYCSSKHKDEDWPQHQALCFAVSTIVHLKDQKHIYADSKNVTGHNYRLVRMQMIVSCEKVLKRRLVPWEQEALLYPRICADVTCREWRQSKLKDCEGCGQISYCFNNPEHLPKSHQRWCKSYFLYQKLVSYQQTKGRLEPKLPSRVMTEQYEIPEKINEVFASMYEEKIDMNDIQYAALTQLATAPLTAAYCHQIFTSKTNNNGIHKKQSFTIHVVGAELQFEADALNKWEVFFLHLCPEFKELRVVLVSPVLNPSNLPLDLLGKIKLCDNCRQNKRRVLFDFQDKRNYCDYRSSDDFISPDIVCAFNASIQKSSIYNGNDPWPSTIQSILKLKSPFVITSNTMTDLRRDLLRIDECAGVDYKVVCEPINNNFASVRPDRNFISDDEMPLLFKNYCFAVACGV